MKTEEYHCRQTGQPWGLTMASGLPQHWLCWTCLLAQSTPCLHWSACSQWMRRLASQAPLTWTQPSSQACHRPILTVARLCNLHSQTGLTCTCLSALYMPPEQGSGFRICRAPFNAPPKTAASTLHPTSASADQPYFQLAAQILTESQSASESPCWVYGYC